MVAMRMDNNFVTTLLVARQKAPDVSTALKSVAFAYAASGGDRSMLPVMGYLFAAREADRVKPQRKQVDIEPVPAPRRGRRNEPAVDPGSDT